MNRPTRDLAAASLELTLGVSAHVQHDALLVLRADDLDARRGPWRQPEDVAALGQLIDRLGYESAVSQGLRHRRNGGAGDVAPITSLAQLRHSGHIIFLWVTPTRTERIRRPAAPPPAATSSAESRRVDGVAGLLGGAAEAAAPAAAADEALWVDVQRHSAVGLLKMGSKKLFLATPQGSGGLKECAPLCCLDFYVLSDFQRQGVGRQLFAAMLEVLDARPEAIAYDRPSAKLRGFLAKHFGLRADVPQTNNFVVFEAFFRAIADGAVPGRRVVRAARHCATPCLPCRQCGHGSSLTCPVHGPFASIHAA